MKSNRHVLMKNDNPNRVQSTNFADHLIDMRDKAVGLVSHLSHQAKGCSEAPSSLITPCSTVKVFFLSIVNKKSGGLPSS